MLIETVLLSTHNICFGLEIRKILLDYILLFRACNTILNTFRPSLLSAIYYLDLNCLPMYGKFSKISNTNLFDFSNKC